MTGPSYNNLPFPQPGQSLQRERRTYREYRDQHGRAFAAQADALSGMPIGELMPVGFNPPWQPPMRFAKWRRLNDLEFRWDYTTMANELAGDTDTYYKDAVIFALENNKPEPEVGGPVDRSIRFVLGKPPLSAAIPLAAELGDPWILGIPGAAVNTALKLVLEQTDNGNAREVLAAIRARLESQANASNVPLVASSQSAEEKSTKPKSVTDVDPASVTAGDYREFVAACMSRGLTMAEAAMTWREHKAALAASEAAA